MRKIFTVEEAKKELYIICDEMKKKAKEYGMSKRQSDVQTFFKIIRSQKLPLQNYKIKRGNQIVAVIKSPAHKFLKLMLQKSYFESIIINNKVKK
jgi:hypothetical protein